MIKSLDEIPSYIEDEVRNRIGVRGDGSTLIVDESEEEFLLAYTGFNRTLKKKYEKACEKRGEDHIRVYQLTTDSSGIQLTKYESAKGMNAEEIWRESVQ